MINKIVGQDITLSFPDDETWRNAISAVSVDGTPLNNTTEGSQYSVTTGTITIDKSVFTTAKDYTIVVQATGYQDASLLQTVNAAAAAEHAVYTLTPIIDTAYTNGTTADGIKTMTVNSGINGLKYFTVNISPVQAHSGVETVVFTHWRDGLQLELNAIKIDLDAVATTRDVSALPRFPLQCIISGQRPRMCKQSLALTVFIGQKRVIN